ncbi:hypothetical protein K439DRAFT_1645815 [Ramaria rubella]|nr:hypothetical protein K439DRAFT_1645815 [Ramaria rubella]
MGDLFLPLWQGKFTCKIPDSTSTWDWAVLKGKPWEEHGCNVAACWPCLPGGFDRPPQNIALEIKSGYKSKEWQGYLYALVPALLHNNFCKLALGICLFHQCAISHEHLWLGQQVVEEHLVEYEARDTTPGPPMLTSQWMMERMIGNLGEAIKQPSNPYRNLSQCMLKWCQVNMLKALIPGLQNEKLKFPQGAEDLGDGYVLLRLHVSYPKHFNGLISKLVTMYMNEARHRLGVRPAPEGPVKIIKWGRLRLPTGQIACSIYKEAWTPLEQLCQARCIKVEFAEVNFYFQISLEVEIQTVALVRLYSGPDTDLHADLCWTVYSVAQLSEYEGFCIVDVKDIQSVIAMILHNHHIIPGDKRFFLWEQMGLDISTLGVPEQDLK